MSDELTALCMAMEPLIAAGIDAEHRGDFFVQISMDAFSEIQAAYTTAMERLQRRSDFRAAIVREFGTWEKFMEAWYRYAP